MLVDKRAQDAALPAAAPFDLVITPTSSFTRRGTHAVQRALAAVGGSTVEGSLPTRPDAQAFLERLASEGWTCVTTDVPFAGSRDESGAVVNLHRLPPPPP